MKWHLISTLSVCVCLCIFYCKNPSSSEGVDWCLEWDFLNFYDSTHVEMQFEYEINLFPLDYTIPHNSQIENGKLIETFPISESKSYVLNNLNLKIELFFEDSTIFDSVMAFRDLQFVKGPSKWGGVDAYYSHLNFYITVPDTTD